MNYLSFDFDVCSKGVPRDSRVDASYARKEISTSILGFFDPSVHYALVPDATVQRVT